MHRNNPIERNTLPLTLDKKNNKEVVERISKALKERGIKQKDFAKQLCWTQSKLSNVLNGRKVANINELRHIANNLDTSVYEILELDKNFFELRDQSGAFCGVVKKYNDGNTA